MGVLKTIVLMTTVIPIAITVMAIAGDGIDIAETPIFKEVELGEVEIPDEWDLSGDEVPYELCRAFYDEKSLDKSLSVVVGDCEGIYKSEFTKDGNPTSVFAIDLYDIFGEKAGYFFYYYYGREPLESLDELTWGIYDKGTRLTHDAFPEVILLKSIDVCCNYNYPTGGMSSAGTMLLYKPFADEIAEQALGENCTFVHFIWFSGLDSLNGFEYTNGEETIIVDYGCLFGEPTDERPQFYYIDEVRSNPGSYSYYYTENGQSLQKKEREFWRGAWREKTDRLKKMYNDSRSGNRNKSETYVDY